MSDPVILLGTQSNGETLPVQVDAFGRLVAEGLQGPEGPEGPSGGSFPLPVDPYEGALLGWLNGELAWIGTPPVPVPPGVFGPITEWDAQSGLLTVQGEILAAVGSGVYVWQCNQDGTYFTEGWNTSQVWSLSWKGGASQTLWRDPVNAFDGSDVTYSQSEFNNPQDVGFDFEPPFNTSETGDNVKLTISATSSMTIWFGKNGEITSADTNPAQKEDVSTTPRTITIPSAGENISSIEFGQKSGIGAVRIHSVGIGDKILVDNELSLNLRVNSVLGQSLLGVPSATVDFTIGKYLRVPEQRVAPWVLYGNDPTSLIDHLRSS